MRFPDFQIRKKAYDIRVTLQEEGDREVKTTESSEIVDNLFADKLYETLAFSDDEVTANVNCSSVPIAGSDFGLYLNKDTESDPELISESITRDLNIEWDKIATIQDYLRIVTPKLDLKVVLDCIIQLTPQKEESNTTKAYPDDIFGVNVIMTAPNGTHLAPEMTVPFLKRASVSRSNTGYLSLSLLLLLLTIQSNDNNYTHTKFK